MIKVCVDPQCNEVAHNCDFKEKRCRTCNGSLIRINAETYLKKFKNLFFQFNYETGEYYRPQKTNGLAMLTL